MSPVKALSRCYWKPFHWDVSLSLPSRALLINCVSVFPPIIGVFWVHHLWIEMFLLVGVFFVSEWRSLYFVTTGLVFEISSCENSMNSLRERGKEGGSRRLKTAACITRGFCPNPVFCDFPECFLSFWDPNVVYTQIAVLIVVLIFIQAGVDQVPSPTGKHWRVPYTISIT